VCRYGEPVVSGYTRSFGMRLPNGERYEYIKPIMFTAGLGSLNSLHAKKGDPQPGASDACQPTHLTS
jgi:phosphoribosylformylglycinamidine synthase